MREYTRQMPAAVMSIVAMLPLAAAQAQLSYTANPYASNATGSVSDHVTDPIIGPTTHEYLKTTGDLVWGYDYINLLDPDEDIFINGWARFSLDGLPADATIESATVSLYAYGYFQPGALGDPMVVTALSINPMTASAQTLYNATNNGTVLSAPAGNLLEMEVPLNGNGLAHLQNAISQGWVALGYRYAGSQGVIDRGYKCHGADYYDATKWPKIAITYSAPGACCTAAGTCTVQTETDCLAAGGTFYGDGTDCDPNPCVAGDCDGDSDVDLDDFYNFEACMQGPEIAPGAGCACVDFDLDNDVDLLDFAGFQQYFTGAASPPGEYHNTVDPMTQVLAAGAGQQIADDLTLAGDGGRELVYYDLRVYGNGGGVFDVTVTLYDVCPGAGGVAIPGTTFTFNGIPDDGYVYTLSVDPLDPPVTISNTVWMAATFSTSEACWVMAGQAEVGFTEDLFGYYNPWECNVWFGGDPYAGLWANLECQDGGVKSCGAAGETRVNIIRAGTFPTNDVAVPLMPRQ